MTMMLVLAFNKAWLTLPDPRQLHVIEDSSSSFLKGKGPGGHMSSSMAKNGVRSAERNEMEDACLCPPPPSCSAHLVWSSSLA